MGQSYKDGNYQEGLKEAFLGTDEDIKKGKAPKKIGSLLLIRLS